ncbi:hypothetical protein [Chishuiella sp.]|uniref:hypothetical protein n=1 Tax=Chishuiella sp. TaxID=1969467 RepID=UPI0028B087FB|nr:hypothetical protein [Chishuiella sp.]
MKKILLLASIFAMSLTTLTSCSSDDDSNVENIEKEDFTNANYIKKIMIGKWQFKAHFSDYWVNTISDSYFIFNADNTYTYKPSLDVYPIENGTYEITPATTEYNAVLKMKTKDGKYTSTLILLSVNGDIAEVQNTFFKERYQKQ